MCNKMRSNKEQGRNRSPPADAAGADLRANPCPWHSSSHYFPPLSPCSLLRLRICATTFRAARERSTLGVSTGASHPHAVPHLQAPGGLLAFILCRRDAGRQPLDKVGIDGLVEAAGADADEDPGLRVGLS